MNHVKSILKFTGISMARVHCLYVSRYRFLADKQNIFFFFSGLTSLNEGCNTAIYAIQYTFTLTIKKEKLSQRSILMFFLVNMHFIYKGLNCRFLY